MVRAPVGKGGKEKQILQMVGFRPEKMIISDSEKVLKIGRVISIKISGMTRLMMRAIRGKALALQAIWIGENWATMAPIARWGGYLGNHDGTCDYDDTNNQTDIDAFKVFDKDNIIRRKQGGEATL